jgi:hypothetical protein
VSKLKTMACIAAVIGVATAAVANAPTLTFSFAKSNVPGARSTFPGGINNAGVSVGTYVDSTGVAHGYILQGKTLTTLDDPDASPGTTGATGVNLNGALSVVGNYVDPKNGTVAGFLYQGGKFSNVQSPNGATYVSPSGINEKGDIVGTYLNAANISHGFLLKSGKIQTLTAPGAIATAAAGINNDGDIIVNWQDSNGTYYAGLYNGNTYTVQGVPGATMTIAEAINTAGDTSYSWFDSNNVEHGALLYGGSYYTFSYPNSVATESYGLNDKSQIVGAYQSSPGKSSGFKATY